MRLFSGIRDWPSSVWGIIFLLLVSLGIKVTALFSGDIINVDGVRYIDAARAICAREFPGRASN